MAFCIRKNTCLCVSLKFLCQNPYVFLHQWNWHIFPFDTVWSLMHSYHSIRDLHPFLDSLFWLFVTGTLNIILLGSKVTCSTKLLAWLSLYKEEMRLTLLCVSSFSTSWTLWSSSLPSCTLATQPWWCCRSGCWQARSASTQLTCSSEKSMLQLRSTESSYSLLYSFGGVDFSSFFF